MRFRSICFSFLVFAAVAGCSSSTRWGHYDIPFDEARARLMKADIVGFRDARQCGYLIHFSLNTPDPETVGWVVRYRERTVASFFVHLTPSGSGVDADFVIPKGPNGGEIYDGKQAYDYPVLLQPLRPALQELVNSAMAQRPFEWRRTRGPATEQRHLLHFGTINSLRTDLLSPRPRKPAWKAVRASRVACAWSMDDPPGFPPLDADLVE